MAPSEREAWLAVADVAVIGDSMDRLASRLDALPAADCERVVLMWAHLFPVGDDAVTADEWCARLYEWLARMWDSVEELT